MLTCGLFQHETSNRSKSAVHARTHTHACAHTHNISYAFS